MRAVFVLGSAALLLASCSIPPPAQPSAPPPPQVGDVMNFHDCSAHPVAWNLESSCLIGELKKRCSPAADCLLTCMASRDGSATGGGCDHVCFSGLHPSRDRPTDAYAACTRDKIPATHEADVKEMKPGEFWAMPTNDLPIWIIYRTPEQLQALSKAGASAASRGERAPGVPTQVRPELFVLYGNCPGTRELLHFRESDGFTCDSNGQRYDLAGRPFPYGSTAAHLEVPAFSFKDEHTLVVPSDRTIVDNDAPPSWLASVTWTANTKSDPVRPVSLGALTVTLEKTRLDEVIASVGSGNLRHQGDASDSVAWVCYRIPDPDGAQAVWLTSSEMGGGEVIDGIVVKRVAANVAPPRDCPEIPAKFQPLRLGKNIGIGTSSAEVREIFGESRASQDSWAYYYEGKSGKYDVISSMSFQMLDDKVVGIDMSHVTSK